MRKRLVVFILIFAMCLWSVATPQEVSAATSVSASFSGGGTCNIGETVTVTLTYSGATFGSATVDFAYDTSVLQLVSSSDGPQSAAGRFNQSIINENGVSSLTCSATFKAIGTGNTTIYAYFIEGSTYDFEPISAPDRSVSVAVRNPQPVASSNADLSALYVSAGSLSPSFSAGTTSYTVSVANDVTTCTISAQPADSKATWDVTGSASLSVGKNVRKVIVTAENGNTKTYTISIYRADKNGNTSSGKDNEVGDNGNEDKNDEKKEDENKQEEPKEILVTLGEKTYIICENYETNSYPKGFQMTTAFYGEEEIPVFKDKDLENTVVILVDKETGEQKWFFYDEENDTFYDTKTLTVEDIMSYEKEAFSSDGRGEKQPFETEGEKMLVYVLLGTLTILFLLIIILQAMIMKGKKKKKAEKKKRRSTKYSQPIETEEIQAGEEGQVGEENQAGEEAIQAGEEEPQVGKEEMHPGEEELLVKEEGLQKEEEPQMNDEELPKEEEKPQVSDGELPKEEKKEEPFKTEEVLKTKETPTIQQTMQNGRMDFEDIDFEK